jgi:hypothetical protein
LYSATLHIFLNNEVMYPSIEHQDIWYHLNYCSFCPCSKKETIKQIGREPKYPMVKGKPFLELYVSQNMSVESFSAAKE